MNISAEVKIVQSCPERERPSFEKTSVGMIGCGTPWPPTFFAPLGAIVGEPTPYRGVFWVQ